jgi:predicted HicB family RNase H-like nuclease
MSKYEKAKKRILNIPSDYQYLEARYLLGKMGFEEFNKGKTSGSRVKFYREKDGRIVMKDNVLEYKGYYTLIRYDAHVRKLRGVINGIDDYVDFSSDQVENIEQEFHQAVDDYLEFCKEVGKEPCKVYKGVFNVRIQPKLHRELVRISEMNGETLNAVVEKALQNYVQSC